MHVPVLQLLVAAGLVAVGITLPRLWLRGARARLRAEHSRRRRLGIAADAEQRARALMSELCPHGWRAVIALHDEAGQPAVVLDWFALDVDGHAPAITRRVRAASVGEALEAMVDGRRADHTLEQIESGADAAGVRWPDR